MVDLNATIDQKLLDIAGTTARTGDTSGLRAGSLPAGTGTQQTKQTRPQNGGYQEPSGQATSRTRSVNATVPFREPRDLERLAEGFDLALDACTQPAIRQLSEDAELGPGPGIEPTDRTALMTWIQRPPGPTTTPSEPARWARTPPKQARS